MSWMNVRFQVMHALFSQVMQCVPLESCASRRGVTFSKQINQFFFSVDIFQVIIFSLTNSPIKWCLMLICLVLECCHNFSLTNSKWLFQGFLWNI